MEERGLRQDRGRGLRHRYEEQGQTDGTVAQSHGDLDPRAPGSSVGAQLPPVAHEHDLLDELPHGAEPLCQRRHAALDVCHGALERPAHPVSF